MIPLSLALELKEAGLVWQADIHDFFAIPDRGLDDRVFVISDLLASLDIFRGWPVVTFHGGAEWALDYILTTEVVWVPTEAQLREALLAHLGGDPDPLLELRQQAGACCCTIALGGRRQSFTGATGAEAYALALRHLLRHNNPG